MSKSTKRLPHNFDDDFENVDEETPVEMNKKQKLKERRLAKFDKIWKQDDEIIS
jgi:hypothetical protein